MARPAPSTRAQSGGTRRAAGAAPSRAVAARRRHQASVRRRRARRRRVGRTLAIAALPSLAIAIIIAGALGVALGAFSPGRAVTPLPDAPASGSVDGVTDIMGVAGLDQEQRDNAAIIMVAGSDLGLSPRDQAIGVMTALGESSLRNIDYGDWETSGVTNPDGSRTTSIGLFQQQDSWGAREQRLDPYTAATLFYLAMIERVPDRDALAPTLVAHRTQVNRDPDHYARYWPRAVALIESLSGIDSGLEP